MRIVGEDYGEPHGEYWDLDATSLAGRSVAVWKHEADLYLEPILPEGAQPCEFETLAELIDSLQVPA